MPIPKPPGKRVGYAVVGLGELALGQILPAFATCAHAAPVALVSGHPEKAKATAAHYGIDPKNIYDYQNFDRIKDNPAVDVIYVVLPNNLHREFTVRGFAAGKHVLCEKPMAPSVADCEAMIAAGKAGREEADDRLPAALRAVQQDGDRAGEEEARRRRPHVHQREPTEHDDAEHSA